MFDKVQEETVVIPYQEHANQYPVHVDGHRYRVLCAGRRWGKSILARQEVIRKALMWEPGKMVEENGIKQVPRIWVVSPTYRQGKEIHWEELKAEVPLPLVAKRQGKYRINESDLEIELANGVHLEIKGADNESSLRGSGLVGVVLDECAYMRPTIWTQIIQPMLLNTNGWALFCSTPSGPNWFKEIYLKGVENSATYDKEWNSWHFTSYDNPTLTSEQVADLDKLRVSIPEEEFKQEYLADFVVFKDLVYKDFRFEDHVIEPFDLGENYVFYRSIDFGFRHATVALWIAVDSEEKWYVVDEFYSQETSTEHNAGVIKSTRPELKIEVTYGDPSAAQLMEDYEKLGVYITPASRSMNTTLTQWVNLGISRVAGKLKRKPDRSGNMVPDLFVFNNCTHLITEMQKYRWKEQPDPLKSFVGTVLKRDDDTVDALRYFAISYNKPFKGSLKDYGFPKESLFRKGFY